MLMLYSMIQEYCVRGVVIGAIAGRVENRQMRISQDGLSLARIPHREYSREKTSGTTWLKRAGSPAILTPT